VWVSRRAVWALADLVAQSILANTGNNTFYGTPSGDTLDGGAGNDTCVFNLGDVTVTLLAPPRATRSRICAAKPVP